MKQTLQGLIRAPVLSLWLCALALFTAGAWAQEDPPGRVGRLAELQGPVSWWDHETGRWDEALRNHPLTGGDRLSTGPGGRAELSIGSTVLRVGAGSEVEVLRLDDERMVFRLHSGNLAFRLRTREAAEQAEIVTAEVRLLPDRAGHYRVGRIDDVTQAGVWRGDLRIDDPAGFVISAGQFVELSRRGSANAAAALRRTFVTLPNDAFSDWVVAADQRGERTASTRHVSAEMTGAEDLDRNGHWVDHPDYGAVWQPDEVRADWAPYRYGVWTWVQPWGWTWVDDAPWGFAPFHYGRWVQWRARWAWVPGAYVARPVYAPALVGFIGGPSFGISVGIGRPPSSWVPLGPREVYAPWYRHGPRYVDRINVPPPYRWHDRPARGPGRRDSAPIMYDNQGLPNAVTVVPRDALQRRGRSPDAEGGATLPGRPGVVRPQPPGPGAAPVIGPVPQRDDRDRGRGRGGDRRDGRDGRDGREGGDGRDTRPPTREPQMQDNNAPSQRPIRGQRGADMQEPARPATPAPAAVAPAPAATQSPAPATAAPKPPSNVPRESGPRESRGTGREVERRPIAQPRDDDGDRKQRPEARPSMRDRETSR